MYVVAAASVHPRCMCNRVMNVFMYMCSLLSFQQYTCSKCSKSFALHGNLMRHMILHDPNHPLYQDCAKLEQEEDEEDGEEELDDEDQDEESERVQPLTVGSYFTIAIG